MRPVFLFLVLSFILCFKQPVIAQGQELIKLPAARAEGGMPLMQALKERKSSREFAGKELSLQMRSDLLWAAAGVNRPASGMRTSPTAMNSQEIEIYLADKKGLYKYDPLKNELQMVIAEDIRALTGKQEFAAAAPLNLIYVADMAKFKGQDSLSAQIFVSMDAGFVSENVYLFCASEGLSTVVRGWFDAEALAKKMGLGEDKKILLCQTVGYPK